MLHAESDDLSVLSLVWFLFKLTLTIVHCGLQSCSLITAYEFEVIVWPCFLVLHVFLKELLAPLTKKQDVLTCEILNFIFFDIHVEFIGSDRLSCKPQHVCQNLETSTKCWRRIMAKLRVSFHLLQLPFLTQISGQVFSVQFQDVKYAIQSFISC